MLIFFKPLYRETVFQHVHLLHFLCNCFPSFNLMSASSVLASLKPSSAVAAAFLREDAADFSSELTSLITRWRRIILKTTQGWKILSVLHKDTRSVETWNSKRSYKSESHWKTSNKYKPKQWQFITKKLSQRQSSNKIHKWGTHKVLLNYFLKFILT